MTTTEIPTTDILGVKISALTMQVAIETIEHWIDKRERHYACICTVHSIMEAQRDPSYRDVLNGAGMRTPDGMPLVWLSHRAGQRDVSRVCGPDLMPELAKRSAVTGHRHFFYGGAPHVAHELAFKLSEQYPGIQIAGAYSPPIQGIGAIESDEMICRINGAHADIVWVGLGSPKQDWWIANHREYLNAPVLIAVGAAFDFHAGRVKRAPAWMQRRGLEWLFRLSQDPRRLWRRYLFDNTKFAGQLLNQKRHERSRAKLTGWNIQ